MNWNNLIERTNDFDYIDAAITDTLNTMEAFYWLIKELEFFLKQ